MPVPGADIRDIRGKSYRDWRTAGDGPVATRAHAGGLPAVAPHGVVDTTGAGDALFAAFLHFVLTTGAPDKAAQRAIVVAGCAARDDNEVWLWLWPSRPRSLGPICWPN